MIKKSMLLEPKCKCFVTLASVQSRIANGLTNKKSNVHNKLFITAINSWLCVVRHMSLDGYSYSFYHHGFQYNSLRCAYGYTTGMSQATPNHVHDKSVIMPCTFRSLFKWNIKWSSQFNFYEHYHVWTFVMYHNDWLRNVNNLLYFSIFCSFFKHLF